GGALLGMVVAQQPGFGFLQCAQYGLPVVGQQLGVACIGGVDARLDQRPVEEAPVDTQGDAAGLGAGGEQVRAAAGEGANQTVKGEAGEEIGGGHADARIGSGQPAFRSANIRAATQHITRCAGGNARLGFRQVARLFQQLDQGGGRLPGEHRDAVHGGADIGAQYRNGGTGAVELGACAHLIEQGTPAGVQPGADNVQRGLLQGDVLLGDPQLLLESAQLEVAAGELTGQGDLQALAVGTSSGQVGFAGFCGAARPAAQVQFPAQGDSGLIALYALAVGLGAFHFGHALAGGAGAGGNAGQLLAAAAAQQGLGFLITGQGCLQALVAAQGLFDQAGQHRIVEAGPEPGFVAGEGLHITSLG